MGVATPGCNPLVVGTLLQTTVIALLMLRRSVVARLVRCTRLLLLLRHLVVPQTSGLQVFVQVRLQREGLVASGALVILVRGVRLHVGA